MSTVSEQQVMKNFTKALSGSVLTGMDKVNEAIKVSTKFNSLQEVIDNMVSDCAKAGGDAEKFLKDYCGIENENNGTYDSRYGFDLDGKTYNELFPQNGNAKYPYEPNFDFNGLTVTVPTTDPLSEDAPLTDKEKLVIEGAYSWWLEDAVKLVEDTYKIDFNGQKINFSFENK